MFVGRERELSVLKSLFDSRGFQCVGVYGHRRVGKTVLLTEFARMLNVENNPTDKSPVPFGWCTAVEDDASLNLRIFSQAVYALHDPNANPEFAPVYPSFKVAVEAAFAAASDKRCVLVIDDFSYLAKSYPAFSSVLQAAIDAHRANSQLFLVLCSAPAFMQEQLLDRKSPLYGRRSAQVALAPFNYFEARAMFPTLDAETVAYYYAMVGGVPLHLQQFDPSLSLANNIEAVFLNPSSILYEEPLSRVRQAVSKAAPYNAVISALANGAIQHNDIATEAGLESGALDYFLKELLRLGIVRREDPVTSPGGRKAHWVFADNLFRFWYRFIRPRMALFERGLGAGVAPTIVDALPDFMAPVFEDICRDWLWRQLAAGSKGPKPEAGSVEAGEHSGLGAQGLLRSGCLQGVTDIGRWWGLNPDTRELEEIDVMAVSDGAPTLVGMCRWREKPSGANQLRRLDARAQIAGAGQDAVRVLFSRSGFTTGCQQLAAEMGNAYLIDFAAMCE